MIELRGVATNNLKSIDARFPLGKITVVTGVSGSGKSSLVFDTLYGEAYRRYVESLSSFARQYLKALPKPDVSAVVNLPPAIAVRQSRSGATNRSTVGTATETTDLLRVLFTHLARISCPTCGQLVEKETPESAARKAEARLGGQRVIVAAPLSAWGKVAAKDLKAQLVAQGFSRLLLAGEAPVAERLVRLEDAKAADLKAADIVVDRVTAQPEAAARLVEASQLAMKAGRGVVHYVTDAGTLALSSALECLTCKRAFLEASLPLFTFNHPLGACPACQGFGHTSEIDLDKVIPDRSKSLVDQGVVCWNFGAFAEYYAWAKTSGKKLDIEPRKPFADYSKSEWAWLLEGDGTSLFDGILGFFAYLDSKKYKAHYRIHAARFRRYEVCKACKGARLNPEALAYRLNGQSLAGLGELSIEHLEGWLREVQGAAAVPRTAADADGTMGVTEALEELFARLTYLRKIGVAYLTLNRSSRTLSGGELQRINMARCLGSALTDTLFCLDEPSCGLHARDSRNLLEVIRELRDQGNTVVLVEHERSVIQGSDHLIEIGPKAGHEGGEVVYAGPPQESDLARAMRRPPAPRGEGRRLRFLELEGAATHNLKGLDVRVPVGAMTAVCGVSGSGKTSLVQHTLYPMLSRVLGQPVERSADTEPRAKGIGPTALIKEHAEVLLVSQAALSRSSRSNIATYLGVMDELRRILAAEPEAKKLGLTAGAFSFNVAGGRCETCRGLGTVVEDLSFLGEMEVTCPACEGRRFGDDVLSVRYRDKSLTEILRLTVAEARSFFFDRPPLARTLDLVIDMGLGYLTLGQHTSSFSGGEAQRLKLVSLMRDVKGSKPSILIFDEPTTGLSDLDVRQLLGQLRALADRGHTIVIIEHHLDVLRAVDWLVEVGPEAAHRGGELVYEGPPSGITAASRSLTAPFMWAMEGADLRSMQASL